MQSVTDRDGALSPEDLHKEGQRAYENGRYTEASRLYLAAEKAYQQAGDTLTGAEMANNASAAWLQAGKAEDAYQAAKDTDKIFSAAGDLRRQAIALGNQAAALDELGKIDAAMSFYQQSADLFQQVNEDEMRAYVLQAISKIQFRTGRQFEALASMQSGLEGIRKPSLKQRFLKRLMKLPLRFLGTDQKN